MNSDLKLNSVSKLGQKVGHYGIIFYRYCLSPYTGGQCRYSPSCSEYTRQAIRQRGLFVGGFLGIKRLFKCTFWLGQGYDAPLKQSNSAMDELENKMTNRRISKKSIQRKFVLSSLFILPLLALTVIACQPGELMARGNWGGVAVEDGYAYFVNNDGRILRFFVDDTNGGDPGELDTDWRYPSSSQTGLGVSYVTPIVKDGILYGTGSICGNPAIDCNSQIEAIEVSDDNGNPDRMWLTQPIETRIIADMAIYEETLLVATAQQVDGSDADGILIGFSTENGRELWRVDLDGEVWGGIVVDNGIAYLATVAGTVYAFDLTRSATTAPTVSWQYNVDDAIVAKPLIANGYLYVGSLGSNGTFYALDLQTRAADPAGTSEDLGDGEWSFDTGEWIWSEAALIDNEIYVGTFAGDLYGLSAITGTPLPSWSVPLELEGAIIGDLLAVTNDDGEPLLAVPIYDLPHGVDLVDPDNQTIVNTLTRSNGIAVAAPLTFTNSILYVQSLSGDSLAFNLNNASILGCGRFTADDNLVIGPSNCN